MIKSDPTQWRLPRISQPQAKKLSGITMLAPREGASPSGSKTWQTRHAQDSPHSRADALTHAPETAGSSHGDLSETTNDPTRHKLWTQKTQDSKPKSSVTDTDGLCSAPGPRLSLSARPPASSPCQAPGIPPLCLPPSARPPAPLPPLFTYTASRCSCRNPCRGVVCHVTCDPHRTRPNLLNGNCSCSTSCYAF